MAEDFMSESFWNDESVVNDGMTLRAAWNAAVSRVAEDLKAKTGCSEDTAEFAAQTSLKVAVETLMIYNPYITKAESADEVAGDYLKADNIDQITRQNHEFQAKVTYGARFQKKTPGKKNPGA